VEIVGDHASVAGTIARVFRGSASLLGDRLTVRLPITAPGIDHPPSGVSRTPAALLEQGKVLEGLFENSPRGVQAVLGLAAVIDAVSDVPLPYLQVPSASASADARAPHGGSWRIPAVALGIGALYALYRWLS
jgi:hypothetical protein